MQKIAANSNGIDIGWVNSTSVFCAIDLNAQQYTNIHNKIKKSYKIARLYFTLMEKKIIYMQNNSDSFVLTKK